MSFAVLAALAFKVTEVLIALPRAKDNFSPVRKQAMAWLAGVALVGIASHAAVIANTTVPDTGMRFGDLDAGSVVLVGMALSSLAGLGADGMKVMNRFRAGN